MTLPIEDIDKIKFVQMTVLLDNIVYNLTKIDREALGKLIQIMEKEIDGYYPLMILVADFYDRVNDLTIKEKNARKNG